VQQLFGRWIASAGLRIENHSLYGNEILPKLGLVTHLTQTTSVRVSAAKGFRSPSIRELYFFPPQNADLKPERLWNYEIGLTQYAGRHVKFEGALFRSHGSNLIRPDNPGFPFQWVNSGSFVHTGYELMFNWLPTRTLELGASWSKLDLGDETLYAPGKKLTVHGVWKISNLTFAGDFILVQNLYEADNRENPLDNYSLLNVTAQIPLFKSLVVKGAVKNVFNHPYQTMVGYPMPGRHVLMELRTLF
jgi:outer membrane cobalamin receptor